MDMERLDKKFDELGSSLNGKVDYEFRQKPVKRRRRHFNKKTVLLVAVIAILTLSTAAIVASPLGRAFFDRLGGANLNITEANKNIDYPLVESKDQGITMKILGAVAGEGHVILSVNFTGMSNEMKDLLVSGDYNRTGQFRDPLLSKEIDLRLFDQNGKEFRNKVQDFDIVMDSSQTIKTDGSYTKIFEIDGSIASTQNVRVEVRRIAGMTGSWNVNFDLTYRPPLVVPVNKDYDIFGKTMSVDRVIYDSISTRIQFRTDGIQMKYYMTNIIPNRYYKSIHESVYMLASTVNAVTLPDGQPGYEMVFWPVPVDARLTMELTDLHDLTLKQSFTIEPDPSLSASSMTGISLPVKEHSSNWLPVLISILLLTSLFAQAFLARMRRAWFGLILPAVYLLGCWAVIAFSALYGPGLNVRIGFSIIAFVPIILYLAIYFTFRYLPRPALKSPRDDESL